MHLQLLSPKSNAKVTVKENKKGNYSVSYNPTEPGEYFVHVTLDGKHIPGSIFHVRVLEQESLGGEGKIRVFYTTTTHTNEKSRPMQELLERKGIHLSPDFEPWIPVDIMEPKDRDAVFRKAGTKTLPIIFIDDVYIGDYYRLLELEESGELNKLLKYNEGREKVNTGFKNLSVSQKTTSAPNKSASAPVKATSSPSGGGAVSFCSNCGTKAGTGKFCSNCGTVIR